MGRIRLLGAAAILAMTCSLASWAQDKGYWRAASSTAAAITGDIAIANNKVTIDFAAFPIAPIRTLTAAEVGAGFAADVNAPGNGYLYRLNVPAGRRFMHHNTLCGTEDTQWMATYVEGRTLQVAFFSGSNTPVFTLDALENSMDRCGTFTYER